MPIINANNIDIWYDTFGKPENPALLLVMGACCQSINWPQVFCEKLAAHGYYVIRYDHRDTGLSSTFDFSTHPYTIEDMMQDAASLMESLRIKQYHVMGLSMGGPISELLSVTYPDRVLTITLVATTCDFLTMNRSFAGLPHQAGTLSPIKPIYLDWMKKFESNPPITQDEMVELRVEGWHILSGFKARFDEAQHRIMQKDYVTRAKNPASHLNHLHICISSESLVSALPSQVMCPTLVIHGTEDPIFPVDHGRTLANKIKDAHYLELDGFGHVPNSVYDDEIIRGLSKLTG